MRRVTPQSADLVLVSMPFGPLRQPSLGLGLLKAALPDVSCRILHFTLPFADRVGIDLYNAVVAGYPLDTALSGEWVFREALFGDPGDVDGYLDHVRAAARPGTDPETFIQQIRAAAAAAPAFLDECAAAIREHRPRIVGFTSVFQQSVASLALARRLKAADPALRIVIGGPNCEGEMGLEMIRQFTFVDVVVSGEADLIARDLIRALLAGEPVDLPGVYTRENAPRLQGPMHAPAVRNLDALPIPDFDDYFEQWAASGVAAVDSARIPLETSRGCWWGEKHHCTFCGLNGATMAFRSKSAARAIGELKHLVGRYGDHRVWVVDNILDMRYLQDFVPELARQQLGVDLFYEVKSNLRKDHLRALAAAGITAIQPGIESFSDSVLRIMRKGVSGLQNIQLLKWCAELGVWPFWHLLWGFPDEPVEDYDRMHDLLPLLTHLPPPRLGTRIRLDRFSPNFFDADRLGLVNVQPHDAYAFIYPFERDALARLAYFFTYDYADGRNPEEYAGRLRARIAEWQQSFQNSELAYVDRGDAIWIWDLRPVARRALSILPEPQRTLYLACDGVRAVASLPAAVAAATGETVTASEVEDLLAPLLEDGVMLRAGDQVLSLATLRSEHPERTH